MNPDRLTTIFGLAAAILQASNVTLAGILAKETRKQELSKLGLAALTAAWGWLTNKQRVNVNPKLAGKVAGTLLLFLLVAMLAHGQTPAPCKWQTAIVNGQAALQCVPDVPTPGPPGPKGDKGDPGPQGPAGPPGSAIAGQPCVSPDGQPTLLVKLPSGTCLPVVVVSNTTVARRDQRLIDLALGIP